LVSRIPLSSPLFAALQFRPPMIALLQVGILYRAIQIDRVAVRFLELIEMQRAIVHGLDDNLTAPRCERNVPRHEVAHRIHRAGELFSVQLHYLIRDARRTRERSDTALRLANESGFTQVSGYAAALAGWAEALEGDARRRCLDFTDHPTRQLVPWCDQTQTVHLNRTTGAGDADLGVTELRVREQGGPYLRRNRRVLDCEQSAGYGANNGNVSADLLGKVK